MSNGSDSGFEKNESPMAVEMTKQLYDRWRHVS